MGWLVWVGGSLGGLGLVGGMVVGYFENRYIYPSFSICCGLNSGYVPKGLIGSAALN